MAGPHKSVLRGPVDSRMISKSPVHYTLLVALTGFLIWLFFFAGPELFDQHSRIGLVGAIVIYACGPVAIFYAYQLIRTSKGDKS
jgi:hypothetical protein